MIFHDVWCVDDSRGLLNLDRSDGFWWCNVPWWYLMYIDGKTDSQSLDMKKRGLTMSHVKTPRNRLRSIRRKQFHSATQSFNHLSHSLRPFDHLRLGRAFPKFSYQEMDEHWKGDSPTRLARDVQSGKGVEQNGGDCPISACSHPNLKV